jgi:hypothetical protein
MKRSTAAVTCAAALVASLAACGSGDDKAAPPSQTGGSSQPATTPTTPLPTVAKQGQAELPAHSTYTYGGLKVVVNLPAHVPSASRPSLKFFADFLQAVDRTTAKNTLDPKISGLAAANVLRERRAVTGGESIQGIGTVIHTIDKVETGKSGFAVITGCLDQSKLVQVRKDGTHFVDAATNRNPTLKMTANINPETQGLKVALFTFAVGKC